MKRAQKTASRHGRATASRTSHLEKRLCRLAHFRDALRLSRGAAARREERRAGESPCVCRRPRISPVRAPADEDEGQGATNRAPEAFSTANATPWSFRPSKRPQKACTKVPRGRKPVAQPSKAPKNPQTSLELQCRPKPVQRIRPKPEAQQSEGQRRRPLFMPCSPGPDCLIM